MTSEAAETKQSMLPAAELIAAWTHARDDPSFYWAAVQRVMSDVCAPTAPPDALARLIFGLSSLGGILLDQLATQSGDAHADLLGSIVAAR